MNTYKHLIINVKPYPIERLIDPRDLDARTPLQQEIDAEVNLALAAPDLALALETLLEAAMQNRITVGDCNQARAALDRAQR